MFGYLMDINVGKYFSGAKGLIDAPLYDYFWNIHRILLEKVF